MNAEVGTAAGTHEALRYAGSVECAGDLAVVREMWAGHAHSCRSALFDGCRAVLDGLATAPCPAGATS